MDIATLRDELTNDPLAVGYAGLTDEQVVTQINTENRSVPRQLMTASEVLNAVDETEYNGLSSANQNRFWQLLAIGDLNPFGVEAQLMTGLFGGGSTTITTLASLRNRTVSRAVELGIGRVYVFHVAKARA